MLEWPDKSRIRSRHIIRARDIEFCELKALCGSRGLR